MAPFSSSTFAAAKHRFFYFRIQPFSEIIFRDTDAHAFDIIHQCRRKIEYLLSLSDVRILFIIGSDCFQDRCAVRHIFCHRSDLIQGRTVGDQSVTGNRSVGRLDSGYTAEGTRLTDGAAGIRSERKGALLCRHRCAGAAGGTSRNMLRDSMDFLSRRKQKSLSYFPWQIHPCWFFR